MLNMILNEREFREARAQILTLDAALSSARALEPMIAGLPPEVAAQVMRAMKVERSELSSLVSAYECARDRGDHDALRKRAGTDPGLTLIVARIAKNLSQKELSWRLGLKEQQIQRYEADRYSNISLKNYTKIATLLGVDLRAEILDLKDFRGIEYLIENVSKSDIKKILKHGRENGWFSNEADESDLKRFIADNKIAFGSPSLLRTGLNVRDHSDDILLHAWRARVSKRAREIIAEFKPRYNPLALTWIPDLVRLSIYEDGPNRARQMMLDRGIVLIAEPQIPGLMIDGAAFLEGEIPVIGMTIRKDSIDNFWFTLLHEIAHATLHYRTGLSIGFFDQAEAEAVDEQEAEANLFASNVLIPEERWRRSAARIANSPTVIEKFARELGVSPSIVFGRIRKERNDYSIFSQNIGTNKIRNAIIGNC
jgi:HTH-type transcriptional regulator/antitoxin HigA